MGQLFENAIDAAVSQLDRYLTEEVSELRRVSREFPNPSYQLRMPELTIISTLHEVTLGRNWEKDRVNLDDPNKKRVAYHVGYLDFGLQMDLWTDSKEERQDIAEKIFRMLNPDVGVTSGLSLTLLEYYDTICRYEVNSTTIADTEDAAIRNEWRYQFTMRNHCDLLIPKDEFIMDSIVLEDSEVTDIVGGQSIDIDVVIC